MLFLLAFGLFYISIPASADAPDKQLKSVKAFLNRIEAAFMANDPHLVTGLLSSKEKTIIVLPELFSTNGVFGSSQAGFIAKKIFKSYSTLAFHIDSQDISSTRGRLTQVRCRWTLKPEDSSQAINLVLFIRLRSEEQRWVISELRSARVGPNRGR